MNNVDNLKKRASVLRCILEKNAVVNNDAVIVLRLMKDIFDDIENDRIVPPRENEFRWYFSNTESPLFGNSEMGEAAAEYSKALELWDW